MVDRSELEAKLAAIKHAYIAELPTRAAALKDAWERVQAEAWAAEPMQELHRLAHSLAGSGATFGFADLSAHARALEIPLKTLLQDTAADRTAIQALYQCLLDALATAAERGS